MDRNDMEYEPTYPDGSSVNECWNRQTFAAPAGHRPTVLIRHGSMKDLDAVTKMEAACFPEAEAAARDSFRQRLAAFPECFWLLELDGRPAACINGCATDEDTLRDEMFADSGLHRKDGRNQMLFGVMTLPEYRHRGLSSMLMKEVIRESRARKRVSIVLTCKEALLPFYGRFGFVNEGLSESSHGGAVWYSMRLTL